MARAVTRIAAGGLMGLDAVLFVLSGELVRSLDRVCEKRGMSREVVLGEMLQELEERYGDGGRGR